MARKLVATQPINVKVGDLVEVMSGHCREVSEVGRDEWGVTFRFEDDKEFSIGTSFPVKVQKWEPDNAANNN
jgi:hypothetical protein